jgi:hypothetical protein
MRLPAAFRWPGGAWAAWCGSTLLLIVLVPVMAWAVDPGAPAGGDQPLLCAAAAVLAGFLVAPNQENSALAGLSGWSGMTAIAGWLWWPAALPDRNEFDLLVAVAVLSFCLGGIRAGLGRQLGNDAASLWMLLLLGVTGSAPLWLGPLAEHHPFWTDLSVFISPLSYLAVMADVDYLRSPWFYQYSPLGGLRFRYPDPATTTAACLLLGIACCLGRHRFASVTPKTNLLPLLRRTFS